MIGISIATNWEFEAALDYFIIKDNERFRYPYGEYFFRNVNGSELLFYCTGVRKVNGVGGCQYMISTFNLAKIIVVGTCAGIDDTFRNLDIVVPNKAVQYDCTVKEVEPLIKQSFIVDIDLSIYGNQFLTGTIGTADKAVVMWKDYLELKKNAITIADTEAAAIAYCCKKNDVECIIIKGISDFPTDERDGDKFESNAQQINVYLENTPKVMNKIFKEYVDRFI
ncbi:Pfs protein [Bacillus sp. JCM 19046]|uniref:Adenosylhomocysteine nucleosidase/adenosylhomocysteine/aminodeoxyfutalosine nucleosidase n=1 Tax=Shouchella xiaoxiensis TaxID=766895 RepID=A0ABS2SVN6_9BACI|nr:permease [Shouchella xiaoxiensis]MBM7839603.1 adenosylhomocysteine nucleosidase/adenosylhomocysteine/aminodeoxyfutalosine nucleosidase [Shouchella xiaoxiensis]GAF13130.1 Pfs protein [Bacillus sp. JCM 19045]GAF16312.1 Pfs protein [Bacillus sp. JCM 19046]